MKEFSLNKADACQGRKRMPEQDKASSPIEAERRVEGLKRKRVVRGHPERIARFCPAEQVWRSRLLEQGKELVNE